MTRVRKQESAKPRTRQAASPAGPKRRARTRSGKPRPAVKVPKTATADASEPAKPARKPAARRRVAAAPRPRRAPQPHAVPAEPEVALAPPVEPTPPSFEQVAQRAYELYLARNGAPGNPLEDWVRAEQELWEERRRTAGA